MRHIIEYLLVRKKGSYESEKNCHGTSIRTTGYCPCGMKGDITNVRYSICSFSLKTHSFQDIYGAKG